MQSVSRFSWRDSKLVTERHIRATRLQIEKNKTHRRVLTMTLAPSRPIGPKVCSAGPEARETTPADERAPTSNMTFFGASSDALPMELQNLILEKAVDAALAIAIQTGHSVHEACEPTISRGDSAIATRKIEAHKETLYDFLLKASEATT